MSPVVVTTGASEFPGAGSHPPGGDRQHPSVRRFGRHRCPDGTTPLSGGAEGPAPVP